MATVYITHSDVMGGGAPVYATISRASQKITSSASSQQATYTAIGGEYVRIGSSGGGIAIMVNGNPTAVSGANGGHFVQDGAAIDLGPLKLGDKVAIIDA